MNAVEIVFDLSNFLQTKNLSQGFNWRNWVGGKQDVHAHIFRPHPLLLSL